MGTLMRLSFYGASLIYAACHMYFCKRLNCMMTQESILFGNYTVKVLDNAEFLPLLQQYRPIVFQKTLDFHVQEALSTEEQSAIARLSPPYTFFLLNGDMELNRNRQLFV